LIIIYNKRNELGKLKTDTAIYFWFRLANRLIRPSNIIEVYRFRYSEISAFQFSSDNVLGSNYAHIKQQFLKTENVIIPDIFSW
jgi:hypothetical protein